MSWLTNRKTRGGAADEFAGFLVCPDVTAAQAQKIETVVARIDIFIIDLLTHYVRGSST